MSIVIPTSVAMALMAASLALSVASMIYQQIQVAKAKKRAKKAADARKGFEIVVEATSEPMPVVYGKALVGGVRVFHSVKGDYVHATPNSDSEFLAGQGSVLSYVHNGDIYGVDGERFNQDFTPTLPSQLMDHSIPAISGGRNEYLFYQQAICHGPIRAAWDVVFDENRTMTDPSLGELQDPEAVAVGAISHGVRIDVHHGAALPSAGEPMPANKACAVMAANYAERETAFFTGLAYASVVVKVNRNSPQFQAVPTAQFLVEGRLVKTVTLGILSEARTYSNNPAWCLLDYLIDGGVGKGVPIAEMDLPSFEAAAAVCGAIVRTNVPVGGQLYQPATRLGETPKRWVTHRDLPRYECNVTLDTSKPIRENVQEILGAMGDARLLWSQGTYKLVLQAPADITETLAAVVATLTDADLVLDQQIEIKWPTTDERLNHATVRYHSETSRFKEESVSWPSKVTRTNFRGVGGVAYSIVSSSSWDAASGEAKLLNSHGVWDGQTENTDMSWAFLCKASGTYTFRYTADDRMRIYLDGVRHNPGDEWDDVWHVAPDNGTWVVTLVEDQQYAIRIYAENALKPRGRGEGPKGVGATLTSAGGSIVWSTRSAAYTHYDAVAVEDTAYREMLEEDSGVELEVDTFEGGITDYYHALAHAEGQVRVSRSAFAIKFQYYVVDSYLEPGDIIKLESVALALGEVTDLFVKIEEVKILEGNVAEVQGLRFDPVQLAWNVNDNDYIKPPSVYANIVSRPEWIIYVEEYGILNASSGQLSWALVPDSDVTRYDLYMWAFGKLDADGAQIWELLGDATTPPYTLPLLTAASAVFAVRAVTAGGAWSSLTTTGADAINLMFDPATARMVDIKPSPTSVFMKDGDGVFNPLALTLTAEDTGYTTPRYKWFEDDTELVGETTAALAVASFDPPTGKVYAVEVTETGFPERFYRTRDSLTVNAVLSDGYWLQMLPPSLTILVDEDGVPLPTEFPFGVLTVATKGGTVLNTGVVYAIEGLLVDMTATLNTATGDLAITAIAADTATATIRATETATGTTGLVTFTMKKVYDAAAVTAATIAFRTLAPPTSVPILGTMGIATSPVGTVDISLYWDYTDGVLPADGFALYFTEDDVGPTTSSTVLATVDRIARSFIIPGVPMDRSYRAGIAAVRMTSAGGEQGALVIGTSWVRIGVPANVTADINGVPASDIADAITNFNTANDRNGGAVIAPVLLTDGTAVDHTLNSDGSADISIEWGYSGAEGDIDGFAIYASKSASSATYVFGTTPAEETVFQVPADKRAFIGFGLAASDYYTIGVRSFRAVDKDVNADGVIASPIVTAAGAGENPYQPSTSVVFQGDVSGTIDGVPATDVSTTVSDTADLRNPNAPTNLPALVSISTATSAVGSVDITLVWSYTQGALKADTFVIHFESAALPGTPGALSLLSPIAGTAAGNARTLVLYGLPMDRSYSAGIVATRVTADGEVSGGLVGTWSLAGTTGNITADIAGTSATTVVSNASFAKAFTDTITNDGIITVLEKQQLRAAWMSLVDEGVKLVQTFNDRGLTTTQASTYVTSFEALSTMLHSASWTVSNVASVPWTLPSFINDASLSTNTTLTAGNTLPGFIVQLTDTLNKRQLLKAALGLAEKADTTKLTGIATGATVGATPAQTTKLSGIAANATVGATSTQVTAISNAAGTANWTSVVSRPTTLSGLSTIDGGKLAGIAANATVGATSTQVTAISNAAGTANWSGVGGVPTTLSGMSPNLGAIIAGSVDTSGNIKAYGVQGAGSTVNIGGALIALDYSVYGYGQTSPLSSSNARVGVLGLATAGSSRYNVGVVGKGVGNSVGIGVVGDGTFIGGFFSSPNTALEVNGSLVISTQTVSNLTAGNAEKLGGQLPSYYLGSGGSTGDVTGPGAANQWGIPVFSDTTGKVLADSGQTLAGLESWVTNSATAYSAGRLGGTLAYYWCRYVWCNAGAAQPAGEALSIKVSGALASSVVTAGSGSLVSIQHFSDRRLKKDIEDEVLGLAFVESLRPRTYKLLASTGLTAHGFIAQEVQDLIPESDSLVAANPDGTLGFDYNGVAAPVVKAIQELSAKVTALEAEVAALRAK